MLCHSQELLAQQCAAPRWKEWIPLFTQQRRLRNLIQIIAYNICLESKQNVRGKTHGGQIYSRSPRNGSPVLGLTSCKARRPTEKVSYYYTLHLTNMSAPFYVSEKCANENPKWPEIDMSKFVGEVNPSINGVIIRIWAHFKRQQHKLVTVWGVHFNGLHYLGPKLPSDPCMFLQNTIVLNMQGGYFTTFECLKEEPLKFRYADYSLPAPDVCPSYSVNLLLRLRNIQQAIKKQAQAAQILREKISASGFTFNESKENTIPVLKKLLNKSNERSPHRQELKKLKLNVEMLRCRVKLLQEEETRKRKEVWTLAKRRDVLIDENQDKGTDLLEKYQHLHKEIEHLKEWNKSYLDSRGQFLRTNARLTFRRKQLISELNTIYPITQLPNGNHTICGIPLPNSEDFVGHDEVTISVGLGYVAHLVQMISIFLQIPLRYPVIHFGSRSKIMDHITDKIPDKDREFPLFSRGKEKLQFNYGVYLLNKNVAQLRWYCGLPTQDLRATLPNLASLLQLKSGSITSHQRKLSGSSVDFRGSSFNISPVGSVGSSKTLISSKSEEKKSSHKAFEKGHRVSKSMGSSDLKFELKVVDTDISIPKVFKLDTIDGLAGASALSYSLDKGLDEYEEMKKADNTSEPTSVVQKAIGQFGHVGSEPILTENIRKELVEREEGGSSGDERQKQFLQSWQAGGPLVYSDEDMEVLHSAEKAAQLTQEKGMPDASSEPATMWDQQVKPQPSVIDNSSDTVETDTEPQANEARKETLKCASDLNNSVQTQGKNCKSSCRDDRQTCESQCSISTENCMPRQEDLKIDHSDEDSVFDSLFASVASRTEALANRTSSFNLMRSRLSTSEDNLS